MVYGIKLKKKKENKINSSSFKVRGDIEVDETTNGFIVSSHYGDVEEGFFNNKKEADDYAKELSIGVTPQEIHKRAVGTYDKTGRKK